ncbi:TPA_asm: lytic transglycosylase, partial [Salmonella enterica subsp. enterica serovar Enteritidis]|nr:lytic transglycosylase [Salmonella enterica subsp. enterica serovar Enteritidis]HAB2538861.1 lytic transglycosylase [Salmonella enterica subsp. enterica serovar Enteritidis]HAB2566024.1 lytic transglycosylase [Salmonella enterica subsp. enterica serovar Enteritidis]HAB2570593.1 lytic transglycosylase [Salmonella enterica subsp. enterica serovar Enteritidis]HAB2643331.1 lytic transglycosylase [Salmonella enterica subsp. enterica serovar Enteritidis]
MKNKNKNGTYDYGAFQINTIWANKLASDFGVKAEQLQHDFC